jgi:hypothetical protein
MSDILLHRGHLPADDYTIMTNAFMRGELPVPLKALERVILGHLLSLRDGWRITREDIDKAVVEGRDAVSTALKGLETAGYLLRSRRKAKGAKWEWTYAVTDNPIERPLAAKAQVEPSPEIPGMARPEMDDPGPDSPGIKEEDLSKKTKDLPDADAPEQPGLDLPLPQPRSEERREDKPLTINQRAVLLAQAHFERVGMGNVPAWVKIIKVGLERGFSDEALDAGLAYLAEQRWTVTAEKLANAVRGGPRRPSGPSTPPPSVPSGQSGRGPRLEV